MNLISSFDNQSSEKVDHKSTSTHKCFNFNPIKSDIYLNRTSMNNDTTSENLRSTKYEAYLPSIDNEWEDYAGKYGEDCSKYHHNRYAKYTLKRHMQKLVDIFFDKSRSNISVFCSINFLTRVTCF